MKIINACKNKLAIFATGALACLAVAAAMGYSIVKPV